MLPWTLFGLRTFAGGLHQRFLLLYAHPAQVCGGSGDRDLPGDHLRQLGGGDVPRAVQVSEVLQKNEYQVAAACPSAYVGHGYLVKEVMVNAAHKRTFGVCTAVQADFLKTASMSKRVLFGSVFPLYTACTRPGVAGDVPTFYQLAKDFQVPGYRKVLKKNSPLLVFCRLKSTAADSKVPASTADVRQSLKNIWAAVGEDNREKWKDRAVFMLINRRAGWLFSSSCATSAEFRGSDMSSACCSPMPTFLGC